MLDVHRGYVDARLTAQPARREIDFLRPLQDHQVDVAVTQLVERNFLAAANCGRAGLPSASWPGDGYQVAVRTGHQRLGPRSVHVPDEHVEAGARRIHGGANTLEIIH